MGEMKLDESVDTCTFLLTLSQAKVICHFSQFQSGLAPWHLVFGVTAALLLVEFVVYALFASGEEQPWNKNAPKEKDEETVELNTKENA